MHCKHLLSSKLDVKSVGKNINFRSLDNFRDSYVYLSVFLKFLKDKSPLITFSWASDDVSPVFQSRMDLSLKSLLSCVQWTPKIHLWCDTRWSLGNQHYSQVFLVHILLHAYKWLRDSKYAAQSRFLFTAQIRHFWHISVQNLHHGFKSVSKK